jgi:uncharacterized protein GlcG (DUF336 family)
MQKLINTVVLGVAGIFVVSAAFAIIQQMVNTMTLQSLTASDISVEQALLIAEGAINQCQKDSPATTVAVVDHDGGVRFLVRGDGASPEAVENARRKAYTARTFRAATSAWMERTGMDAVDDKGKRIDLYGQRLLENTLAQKGGLPIIWHGDAIGGVGVTGSKGGEDTDETCAKAGVDAIADQLF